MKKPIRVLMLEDQPLDAELELHELRQTGFDPTFIRVDSEAEYLKLLDQPWDVILADYTMPQFDAIRALDILQERALDIPLIVVSGTIGEEVAVSIMKHGAADYLMKDRLMRLGLSVAQALERQRLRIEKETANELLAARERHFRALIENSADEIALIDANGNILYTSPSTHRLMGYSEEELQGKNAFRFMHHDDVEMMKGLLMKLVQEKSRSVKWEARLRHKDNSWNWFEGNGTAFLASPGEPQFVINYRDISQRKRAEEERDKLFQALNERIKELTAMHRIGRILQMEDISTGDHLREIVTILPDAWQYPKITAARIRLGDAEAKTANFHESPWTQSVEFWLSDGTSGSIQIIYLEERPQEVDGPFLAEETALLKTIAESLRLHFEHKLALEALRSSEERFSKAFQANPIPLSIATLNEGRYIDVNESFLQVYGYSREEVIGRTATDLKIWLDPSQRAEIIRERQKRGPLRGVEVKTQSKNGQVHEMLISVDVISLNGEPCLLALALDISERKRSQEALQQSEEKYRNLVQNMSEGVGITDAHEEVVFANPAAEEIFGVPAGTLVGRRLGDFLDHSDLEYFHQQMQDRTKGKWEPFEVQILRPSLEKRLLLVTMTGRFSADGNYMGSLGIFHDVTERRNLELQLQQSQKMEAIGKLAGGIAHDFNNLLTTILGYCDLAQLRLRPDDPLQSSLEQIHKAGDHAAALTRQLLAFSRKQVLQPTVMSLNNTVTGMEKMLRRLIGEDIEIYLQLDPHLQNVRVDGGQVEQIIMNMAVNARDAMPNGGRLTIETGNVELGEDYVREHLGTHSGPHVLLAISDTGCGMDADTKSHLFEPFFTTKEKGKGTGLGLSTVYGIVQQSGGSIFVYSEMGLGTTFKIYFPVAGTKAEAEVEKEAAEGPTSGRETILVVEDELGLRQITVEMLKARGYRVVQASCPAEAVALCSQPHAGIQLMLTDVVMPDMNGYQLAKKVKALQPDIRILFMSGFADESVARKGYPDVEFHFIEKPFSSDLLQRRIREALADHPAHAFGKG